MKRLAIVVVGLVLAWSGYWAFTAAATKSSINAWFQTRHNDGWSAEVSDISVLGYPYRLDTTLSGVSLGDPGTGLAWEAEFFQILALSYRPNHIIAVWPHEQMIATPFEKYNISTSQMRASAVLGIDRSLPVNRASLQADTMKITAVSGGVANMDALRFAMQHLPQDVPQEGAFTYKIAASAQGLMPAKPWKQEIDPSAILPRRLTALTIDMIAGFDAPWDRHAIEDRRPQPTSLHLKLAKMHWGDLEINVAGDLDIDPQGYATGSLSIKARNWRDILRLAVAAQALPQSLADTIESGLSLVSQLSGNAKTLDVTLDFKSGRLSIGPIPLGKAPRMRIR